MLKCCPFCGADAIGGLLVEGGFHSVGCSNKDCDVAGPIAKTVAKAAAAWNGKLKR